MKALPTKTCAACGRTFSWRRRWARDWESVRYCSRSCRGRGVGPLDAALEAAILDLLRARPGGTICPSEAARRVRPDDWRPLMEATRRAARRLAGQGRIEVTQGGRPVDPGAFRGAVRLRPGGRAL